MKKNALSIFLSITLVSCSNHVQKDKDFENALINRFCSEDFFGGHEKRISQKSNVIYTGINAGLVARSCGEYNKSNLFFDAAEDSYKLDVDLEGIASKSTKTLARTLINNNILDYDGTLYERIMVNSYKGLNHMSLGDFENARVEFNRALFRQDKAKEYFAKQIEKNRKEFDEAEKHTNKATLDKTNNDIMARYDHLFEEFETTKDFINPYATYLASVFFYMDKDYRKASDLFKEIAIIHPDDHQIQAQFKLFEDRANTISPRKSKSKSYIFISYEDGFGTIKDEFKFTLPLSVDSKLITTSFSMPTLKKRNPSHDSLLVNNIQTTKVVDFDNIVATEFKFDLPGVVSQAVASTVVKTALNASVAKNDSTGGLLSALSSIATTAMTQTDVRSWRGLPKSASIALLENNGALEIVSPDGKEIFKQSVDKNKDILVTIRSFAPYLPAHVSLIER
jgi:hypothetical protein